MFIVQSNNPGPIEAFNTWIMIGSILFSSSVHPQFYVTKRHDKMIYMSRTSWNQSVDCEVSESTSRLCHNQFDTKIKLLEQREFANIHGWDRVVTHGGGVSRMIG